MAENDESIFRGTSKLKSLLKLMELYYYMIKFQRQFFKNNALPGFVLSTDNILSQRVKQRLSVINIVNKNKRHEKRITI